MWSRPKPFLLLLSFWSELCLLSNTGAVLAQDSETSQAKPGAVVARLAGDVTEAETVVSNSWVIDWMAQVAKLPHIEPRTVKLNNKEVVIDESLFYFSRYGSPLAYARALDLAVTNGFEGAAGSRIFDFGYGSIGHLRMFALLGHHAVGVDVAPLLREMYAGESGSLGEGTVHLLDGRFPKESDIVSKVGGGEGGMKLETDLFAWYTIVRKKPNPESPNK